MSNFRIVFDNPLWLLLLIPATALALVFYFRLSKKYRFTRARITSLVLYLLIMLLSISVLSGITFAYKEPIATNEMILLVDVSYSNRESEVEKNKFIKTVLDKSAQTFNIGIVTFAHQPVYAAELNSDAKIVYEQYEKALAASRLDETAPVYNSSTNIAEALIFTKNKFSYPQAGRIILITDGLQTDGDALYEIMMLAGEGIKVDVVLFQDDVGSEIRITDITFPNYNIEIGKEVEIGVTVQSNYEGKATITLYDNNQNCASGEISVKSSSEAQTSEETFYLRHTFLDPGFHEIYFTIKCNNDKDTVSQNNLYYSYIFIDVYDKLLIIEREDGESDRLKELLTDRYSEIERPLENIKVLNINDVPLDIDKLREWDQIILVNIANADMPKASGNIPGFAELLKSFVQDYGGGLLTVGGNLDGDGDPIAYNRKDMVGTVFQSMLPIDCINYTPPLALMIIIDHSGSMGSPTNIPDKNRLDLAKEGVFSCLDTLSDRDYVGLVQFDTTAELILELTPAPQKWKIEDALEPMEPAGGTNYYGPLAIAAEQLKGFTRADRKQILFITDGEPQDQPNSGGPLNTGYLGAIKDAYANGITVSVISIAGSGGASAEKIQKMAEAGGGNWYDVLNVELLPGIMLEEVKLKIVEPFEIEPYIPTVINEYALEMAGIDMEKEIPALQGFYGTRAKSKAEVILLAGDPEKALVPLYAKWDYGQGKVGSFMCDLSDMWSSDLLADPNWMQFIFNAIRFLSPVKSIRAPKINAKLETHNYKQSISVLTQLDEGEKFEITVVGPPLGESNIGTMNAAYINLSDQSIEQTFTLDETARGSFNVYEPGVYKITIRRKDSAGNLISEHVTYTTFSYSAEYDVFVDLDKSLEFITRLAQNGKGTVLGVIESSNPPGLYDPNGYETMAETIFKLFPETLDKTINPQIAFIITALILFLLSIAARKFKWKWPWEIVRDRKAKKELMRHSNAKPVN